MITDEDRRKIGETIYKHALSDRRGFRPDQIGIDDKAIWNEIYNAIAAAALPLIRAQVVEECAARLELEAKEAADFVRNNANLMHPMRNPSEKLKLMLDDRVQTDRKFRSAARSIRALSPREAGE